MTESVGTEQAMEGAYSGVAPGRLLAAERQRQGLTVADVARHLKLTPRQLEALEADDYSRLPGMTFVRGFLRNYARLLQVEPEPLLAALPGGDPAREIRPISAHHEQIEFSSGRSHRWLWRSLALLIVLIGAPLLAYQLLRDDGHYGKLFREGEKAVEALRPPASHPVAPPLPVPLPAQSKPEEATDGQLPVAPATAALPSAAAASAMPETGAPAAAPAVKAEAPVAGEIKVHLAFDKDAWVEIRDKDGKRLLGQLNAAGSEQTVTGAPPLAFVVGNATAVRITYNGKLIDLAPYTRVNVARFTLP